MKITATSLEAFRQYLYEKITLHQLIDRLSGKQIPSPQMEIGKILHKILENDELYQKTIDTQNIDAPENLIIEKEIITALPRFTRQGIPEYKKEKEWEKHILIGVVDRYCNNFIVEYKFNFSTQEELFTQYYNSYQWRFYLYLFDIPKIRYEIFSVQDKDFITFEFWQYNNIAKDVECLCREFIKFREKYNV